MAVMLPATQKQDTRDRQIMTSRVGRYEAFWGYIFIAAPLSGFVVFLAGPLIASVFLSFTNWDLLTAPKFNGLANWQQLFTNDPLVFKALGNTLFFMLGIPIGLALSLLLALALNTGIHGKSFFRLIYYMPTILPLVAVTLVWAWIFNPDFGLLNYFLQQLGVPIHPNWLQDSSLVKPAIIIMSVWSGLGYSMLIFLAGLQGVPRHLYEAAELDGAGQWAKFWNVTWPALSPTTFFLFTTGIIGGFQIFLVPYIMTRGGPARASTPIVQAIWENAFTYLHMGYASSEAWLLGLIIMFVTFLNFQLAKRWVFYE